MKRVGINKADITIVYPDHLTRRLQTRPDADLATDCVKFASWLRQVADDMDRSAAELAVPQNGPRG